MLSYLILLRFFRGAGNVPKMSTQRQGGGRPNRFRGL